MKNFLFYKIMLVGLSMMMVRVVGFMGALGTTASFLPQVVRMYRSNENEMKGFSPWVMVIHGFGVSNWIVYGVFVDDLYVIVANSLSLLLVSAMAFRYVSSRHQGGGCCRMVCV